MATSRTFRGWLVSSAGANNMQQGVQVWIWKLAEMGLAPVAMSAASCSHERDSNHAHIKNFSGSGLNVLVFFCV